MLGSSPLSPPPGRSALPPRTTAFVAAARAAGLATELVPIAVHAAASRPHPAAGVVQNPCNYSGNWLFGCAIGAKNTLDLNYLALAEHRYGAEILPLHVVDQIAPSAGGGYQVHFRSLDPDPALPRTPGMLRAAGVVVAAPAIGSPPPPPRLRDRHPHPPGPTPAPRAHPPR